MFKNILCVEKSTKLQRVKPKVQQLVFHNKHFHDLYLHWKQAMLCHKNNASKLYNYLGELKKNVKVIQDLDLRKEDLKGADLVITVGGDGTFMRAASFLRDNTPLLGINSDHTRSTGALCQSYIDQHGQVMRNTFQALDQNNYILDSLSRIKAEIKDEEGKAEVYYALNDVFLGEKEIGDTSSYNLTVDELSLGRLRSSGLLISTGTGSTAWLSSAKSFHLSQISNVIQELNLEQKYTKQQMLEIEERINKKISFPRDSKELFYYVREGLRQREGICREGFGRMIQIQSHCLNGIILIDGFRNIPIDFGNKIELSVAINKPCTIIKLPSCVHNKDTSLNVATI